jgi:hypothetical protein
MRCWLLALLLLPACRDSVEKPTPDAPPPLQVVFGGQRPARLHLPTPYDRAQKHPDGQVTLERAGLRVVKVLGDRVVHRYYSLDDVPARVILPGRRRPRRPRWRPAAWCRAISRSGSSPGPWRYW